MAIQDDILGFGATGGNGDIASSLDMFRTTVGQREQIVIASQYKINATLKKLAEESNLSLLKATKKRLDDELKEEIKKRKKLTGEELEAQKKLIKEIKKERDKAEQDILDKQKELRERAAKIELIRQENIYKKMNVFQKANFLEEQKNRAQLAKQEMEEIAAERMANAKNAKERKAIEEELRKLREDNAKKLKSIEAEIAKIDEQRAKIEDSIANAAERYSSAQERTRKQKEKIISLEKELLAEQLKLEETKDKAEKEALKAKISELQDELNKSRNDFARQQREEFKAKKESIEYEQAKERASRDIDKEIRERGVHFGKTSKDDILKQQQEEAQRKYDEAVEKEKALKQERAQKESEAKERGAELSDEDKAYYAKMISESEAATDAASMELATIQAGVEVQEKYNKIIEEYSKKVAEHLNKLTNIVDTNIDTIKGYQATLLARLQGTDKRYTSMLNLLKRNLSASPFVSMSQTLDNLSKLVDMGIAYNVEERAFLATISDKIATTFDGFNTNLMRLIRLQQADTTAARLGMEAYLTKFLNNMFSDTSYLSDLADGVAGAIIDAETQMSYAQAAEFEYILQKWMGSLYSLGFSENAITSIVQGINMLATGDVQGLASNESMQTLLAMSASRSETVDYAQAITDGLDSSQLNDLMRSMVGYLQEIVANSDNKAVKAAFGDIFDMSFSDFAAIQNLTQKDIENIYSSTLSYGQAYKEVSTQMRELVTRVSLSEMVGNVFQNAMFSVSESLASDPIGYSMWLLVSAIEDLTGGINLPAIHVMGNAVDLSSFTIEGIMKSAMMGMSLMGNMGWMLASLGSSFAIGDLLDWWGATQTTSRGTGIALQTSGVSRGVSASDYVGSSSTGDIKRSSVQQASDESSDVKQITSPDAEKEKSLTDFWKALFEDKSPIPIYAVDTLDVHDEASFNKVSAMYSKFFERKEAIKVEEQKSIVDTIVDVVADIVNPEEESEEIPEDILSVTKQIRDMVRSAFGFEEIPQYARGTSSASRGLALVGERGPELVDLNGGETIFSNVDTISMLSSVISHASPSSNTNLINLSKLISDSAEGKVLNVAVTNDVSARLVDTDKSFEEKIKFILSQPSTQAQTYSQILSDDERISLKELLEKIANGNVNVNVVNSNFDEFLEKSVYQY